MRIHRWRPEREKASRGGALYAMFFWRLGPWLTGFLIVESRIGAWAPTSAGDAAPMGESRSAKEERTQIIGAQFVTIGLLWGISIEAGVDYRRRRRWCWWW